jgi:hypothetical protein
MAATATTYFGNRAKAAITAAGASPSLADLFTVGRGWEANITWDTAELYGTDSIFRVDEAKHTLKAEGKLKGCKFDPAGAEGVFKHIFATLNGAAGGTGAIADTNAVYLMDVYIYGVGTATGSNFSVEISNAYLEGVPIPFPENDFITLDLTFKGRGALIGTSVAPIA